MEKVNIIKLLEIFVIEDVRGNLGVIESDFLFFDFKWIYYFFDVLSKVFRGGYVYIN